MKKLLAELKRRNVLRAGLLYVGALWALAQGVSELTPAMGLPEGATRWLIVAAAIGFPLWLLFAWFYELTPDGFRLERDVPEDESIKRQTGRRLDYLIIAVLSVAVVLLLTDRLLARGGDPVPVAAAAEPGSPHSIAVLPLVNAGRHADEDYFSDGLTEELISGLARVEDLRVIARGSAFEFKDSKVPRAEIAGILGVDHLLEGSVRRSGDRIRIMVELVRPGDNTSLWSQTYNRELRDIFAVQAEIAGAVASALAVQLGATDEIDYERPPNDNLAAYQAMLQGHAQRRQATEEGWARAAPLYREAIRLEPDYAAAHVNLALALLNLAVYHSGTPEMARLQDQARFAVERAMALAPGYHGSHRLRGYVLERLDGDTEAAGAAFLRARELAPHDGNAAWALAGHLLRLGRSGEAAALMEELIAHDPLDANKWTAAAWAFDASGRHEDGFEALRRALAIAPERTDVVRDAADMMRWAGRYAEAEALLREAIAAHPDEYYLQTHLAWVLEGQNRYEEAWRTQERALASQPGNAWVQGSVAMMLGHHGRNAESADHARRAMQASQAHFLHWDNVLARALASLGRLDEAEHTLRAAIARNPQYAYLNANLAMVAAQRGDVAAVRPAAEAETDPAYRAYALAMADVLEDGPERTGTIVRRYLDDCTERRHYCLNDAATLHALAGQPGPMFGLLEEAADDPAWRPDLGHPFLAPYLHHPRFLALLDRYDLSPPSPVSQRPQAH